MQILIPLKKLNSSGPREILLISGVPARSSSVEKSISFVKRQIICDADYFVHCWINSDFKVSFFKSNSTLVWVVFQITKLYRPSRLFIDKIYGSAIMFSRRRPAPETIFRYLGLDNNIVLESISALAVDKKFCSLNSPNLSDLERRSIDQGSSNLLGFSNMSKMFGGMQRCLDASRSHLLSDIVVRIRPDIIIDDIDIKSHINNILAGEVDVVSYCKKGHRSSYGRTRIPDQLFITRVGTMKKIISALSELDSIYDESKLNCAEGFGGEVILGIITNKLDMVVHVVEGIVKIER